MPKAAPARKPAPPKVDPLSQFVDELGNLEAELAPLKPKLARVKALRELLRSAAEEWPNGAGGRLAGRQWDAVLGPRGNETTVDVPKLQSLLTLRAFLPLVSITLTKLKAQKINPAIVGQVVKVESTGPRPLDVVARQAA